jgi:putative oligomerization/nucleic acid binding protein
MQIDPDRIHRVGLQGSGDFGNRAAPAAGGGRVDTLERLAALRASGALTDEEYQAEKTIVTSNGT